MARRIGIITGDTGMFSNGLIQNAYFLYKTYKNLGIPVDLLCYNDKYTKLDSMDVEIKTISEDPTVFPLQEYRMIITVAKGISKDLYVRCKEHRVHVVGFVCGNSLFLHLEEICVEGQARNTIVGKERPVDEIWYIGSYEFMKTYLELMRGVKAYPVPHLWSPALIEHETVRRFKDSVDSLLYTPRTHITPKIDIVVLEPNMSIVKTSLIPIMAAEHLFLNRPSLINEVFVFNFPSKSPHTDHLLDNLAVKSKIRRFKSLHIAEILMYFNRKDTIPIFVSHQLYNEWNYLYYELMYYGFPLVHNSNAFKDYGYFYSDFDIAGCSSKIEEAFDYHGRRCLSQREANRTFLKTIDPEGVESQTAFRNLLRED
jgi:hypothetical protein